jgi:WD40 repeat protein/tRNA A-37 threonylcarbamoyl transferase component Bud32
MVACPPTEARFRSELETVLAAYLQAEESGESPDRGQWLARYPQLADELQAFFDSRDVVPRLWPDRLEMTTPCRFGEYELLEKIAHGGMGVVYKARQLRPNRIVALKLILSGQLARRSDVERFHAEAEAAASLDHPNIVPIYEVGQQAGQHYFTMKFIEGGSLAESEVRSQRSEVGKRTQSDAARLMATVARAVHYAHQRGILHRDLKPGNILLDATGQPYVSDFGLAKQISADNVTTHSATIVGTASYMAPEQAAGRDRLTTAADIYSLGAIFYWLLTGRPAIQAATPLETLRKLEDQEPVRPRAIDPHINRDLETICLKCLEKDPARRYGSAEALAHELKRWLAGEPIFARPSSSVERLWRWCRRNPASAAAGGLAVVAFSAVVALAVGSVFAMQLGEEQERTQAALKQAETQQAVAEQKGAEANTQRQRAEEQEKLARHYLYGANILLAQRAWDSNHVDLALDYLERHIPQPGEADIRGFEWHYLWRRAHADLLTLQTGSSWFAYTADGKQLLTPMRDGQMKVWDAASGKEIGTRTVAQGVEGRQERVFSPDGQRVASGTKTGSIKVWDAATGQEVITLKGDDKEIALLAFSPDGKRLASAAREGRSAGGGTVMKTRKVWDLTTGREIVTIHHDLKPGNQWSLVFSPDGTRLASGSDGAIKIWDATTGQEVRSIEGPFGPITAGVAFSPDGKWLAAGSQHLTARVWDVTTGQELFTLTGHTSAVWDVSFSPDGKRLATGSKDATVKVWDLTTGKEIRTFKGHRGDVWNVAYSPDGTRIASGSADKTLKIWDATALDEGRMIKGHTGGVSGIAFSPDGKRLASASSDSVGWDQSKNEPVKKLGADQAHLWDVTTGQRIMSLDSPSGFGGNVAFSADGKHLVTDSQDGMIRIWDAGTGQEIRSFQGHTSAVGNLAFSPDGKIVVFGTENGLKLYEAATGKELLTSKDGLNMAGGIKFSRDGKRLAASKNAAVNVLDTTDGKVLLQLRGHTAYCIGVAFSPDGKWLASGSWDNTAKLWDASTGQELLTLKGHTGYVTFVTFSPDSKRLATMSPAAQDRTLKLWDASTGQELLTLNEQTGKPVFSPDGKLLATRGRGGSIHIWDATPLAEGR